MSSKPTRLQRCYSALRSGKVVTRADLAKAMGDTEGAVQVHVRWIQSFGIQIETVREGRTDKSYRLVDVDKLKDAAENGGRLTKSHASGSVAVPKAISSKTKGLSAKQAGKTSKRQPKAAKPTKTDPAAHLKDVTLWDEGEDRPAVESTGKVAILDKEIDFAAVSEREFNDIKSMLGIEF